MTPCLLVPLLAFVLLAPRTAAAVCGDQIVQESEDCDDGDSTGTAGQACGAACRATMCGKPTGSAGARPSASDALFTLRAATGTRQCDVCVCDTNGNATITASDALSVLRSAVGQITSMHCASCFRLKRRGRFTIRHRIDVAEEDRQELLDHRAEIESDGAEAAGDGSYVLSPVRPAAGWPVVFGQERAVTDENGEFEIEIEAGQSTRGTVAYPSQIDDPVFAITAAHLTPADQEPAPVDFTMIYFGPCGMHDEPQLPDPPQCGELVPAEPVAASLSIDWAAATTDPVVGTTTGPLGTYPAGNQNCCRDYDGHIPSSERGTKAHYLAYFGSLCEQRVDGGCCAGERGTLVALALDKLGAMQPTPCRRVHHGRFCQELEPGDVSVNAAGIIIKKRMTTDVSVHLGSTNQVVVHNNGCFGETFIDKREEEIFGNLSGPNFAGGVLKHFVNQNGPYFADQTLTYTLAPCVTSVAKGEHDTYSIHADGFGPRVRFVRSNEQLWKFLPEGPIFSNASPKGWVIAGADLCDGTHVHGLHPCNGAPEPPDASPCGHGRVEPVVLP